MAHSHEDLSRVIRDEHGQRVSQLGGTVVGNVAEPELDAQCYQLLREYFGQERFRVGQRPLIKAAMDGLDTGGVIATGGGKSLCFQLEALRRFLNGDGLTIVISPLVPLMNDQHESLRATVSKQGIPKKSFPCAVINSSQDQETVLGRALRKENIELVRNEAAALLILSPEMLTRSDIAHGLLGIGSERQLKIARVVIDESHVVHDWEMFRLAYLRLAALLGQIVAHRTPTTTKEPNENNVRSVALSLFTATAPAEIWKHLTDKFRLNSRGSYFYFGEIDRTNLLYENVACTNREEKNEQIIRFLREFYPPDNNDNRVDGVKRGPGFFYVGSRKAAEKTVEAILQVMPHMRGKVDYFHAKRPQLEKDDVLRRLSNDEIELLVTTNAVGMGYDKQNIRLVIVGHTPPSLDALIQLFGRGGRDGDLAKCLLFFTETDMALPLLFMRQQNPDAQRVLKTLKFLEEGHRRQKKAREEKEEERKRQGRGRRTKSALARGRRVALPLKYLDDDDPAWSHLVAERRACLGILEMFGFISEVRRGIPGKVCAVYEINRTSKDEDFKSHFPTSDWFERKLQADKQRLKVLLYYIVYANDRVNTHRQIISNHCRHNTIAPMVEQTNLFELITISERRIQEILKVVMERDYTLNELKKALALRVAESHLGNQHPLARVAPSDLSVIIEYCTALGYLRLHRRGNQPFLSLGELGHQYLHEKRIHPKQKHLLDSCSTWIIPELTDFERYRHFLARLGHEAERKYLGIEISRQWYSNAVSEIQQMKLQADRAVREGRPAPSRMDATDAWLRRLDNVAGNRLEPVSDTFAAHRFTLFGQQITGQELTRVFLGREKEEEVRIEDMRLLLNYVLTDPIDYFSSATRSLGVL